jgi:predicted nucleotide-binding protein
VPEDNLPQIDSDLRKKLEKKLGVKGARIYQMIDAIARQHTQPRHFAALLLARDEGVNFLKFASREDLAIMQGIKNHVQQPFAGPAVPSVSAGNPHRRRQTVAKSSNKKQDSVFVVHGRDAKARKELSAFLRSLHVDVMEWNKAMALTKKASPYIGEVIDAAFDLVQAIVVMLTPDDLAMLKDDFRGKHEEPFEKKLMGQPRQNVLLEAGMALAKSRQTTILVQIGRIRPMSDISGVHVTHLTGSASSRQQLIGKLRTAGVKLDSTGDDWLTEGDFSGF